MRRSEAIIFGDASSAFLGKIFLETRSTTSELPAIIIVGNRISSTT